jgi:hypothetical protein
MAKYRVIEMSDSLVNEGKLFWRVEKLCYGIWWDHYFEEHSEDGAQFYDREEALKWWKYHCEKKSQIDIKVIAQN